MNIHIDTYGIDELKKGAQIALSNRLFQIGWDLGWTYRYILQDYEHNVSMILIATVDNIPVASAVVDKRSCWEFQVFVRKSYRRNGIGSSLYAEAMKAFNRTKPFKMCTDHFTPALHFYRSNKEKDWSIITEDNDNSVLTEESLKV